MKTVYQKLIEQAEQDRAGGYAGRASVFINGHFLQCLIRSDISGKRKQFTYAGQTITQAKARELCSSINPDD